MSEIRNGHRYLRGVTSSRIYMLSTVRARNKTHLNANARDQVYTRVT